jgi:ABC-2 type transport system ATP-binding protein
MNEAAIEVEGLTKRFGDFVAVEAVSFAVPRGEVFGLLGPNGAGKSTTIRMLCGILLPSGGSGRVASHDIVTEPEAVRQRIGYMSQRFSLYLDLTVAENLEFYGGVYGLDAAGLRERKQWALQMSGLAEQQDKLTADLSAGWRQRLALGCALLHRPEVVFLDEPTAGADPISRRQFWEVIYQLRSEGITTLVSTHYMDEAERCDRLGFIFSGRLVALDRPDRLKRAPAGQLLVAVECDRPAAAVEALTGRQGVVYARLHRAGLHVLVEAREGSAQWLRGELEASGFAVARAEPVGPSLEDVFVSLIRDAEEPTSAKASADKPAEGSP